MQKIVEGFMEKRKKFINLISILISNFTWVLMDRSDIPREPERDINNDSFRVLANRCMGLNNKKSRCF